MKEHLGISGGFAGGLIPARSESAKGLKIPEYEHQRMSGASIFFQAARNIMRHQVIRMQDRMKLKKPVNKAKATNKQHQANCKHEAGEQRRPEAHGSH